jgi:nucleotide-binding universal stress UspA family protein
VALAQNFQLLALGEAAMKKLTRILVPVDFSTASREAAEHAVALARCFGAKLELLHVWEPPRYVAPDVMIALPGWSATSVEKVAVTAAQKELSEFTARLLPEGLSVSTRVDVGEAAHTILRVAEETMADLIAMGTHGRSGLARMLLGSVAQKIVSHAPCPVLTVRHAE